ncbi:hypothetical protein GGP41_004287 [Bipolaris sorokiniana]|uniref:Uncharacterized protein n=1 Tax=Cochliobolus sativus TaxID=45130 RepID=A0A8H5ZNL7_COCSA|nr:hypothetical protein GGP41_004287 [Bipolaris sorokiniana]
MLAAYTDVNPCGQNHSVVQEKDHILSHQETVDFLFADTLALTRGGVIKRKRLSCLLPSDVRPYHQIVNDTFGANTNHLHGLHKIHNAQCHQAKPLLAANATCFPTFVSGMPSSS